MIIEFKQASSLQELQQVLDLQRANLRRSVSATEKEREGFLTVEHNLEQLRKMNEVCGHILAKEDDVLAGYALCMHPLFSGDIEVLRPMFEQVERILPDLESYMVMGQICIRKEYRGKGIFRGLYDHMKKALAPEYASIITEVDRTNIRSLAAHRAIGFVPVCSYTSGGQEWEVIRLNRNENLSGAPLG